MDWNNRALALTAALYTIALFLLLFLGFRTPLPLPGEQGILINFGEDETGFGSTEPKPVEKVVKLPEQAQVKQQQSAKEDPLTQDYEDAPAVKTTKPVPKPVTPTTETQKTKTEDKPVEQPKPVRDERALFGRNKNTSTSGSEGVTTGTGNQGAQSGDESSTNYSLGGGLGDGIGFDLAGRVGVSLPYPEYNYQKEGKVVVQVTVDRSGKVINAVPGVKGSETYDSYLLNEAKKAALASRFNAKETAAEFQVGTITYVFRLR